MKSHGRYTIETIGRMLSVDATGPFNDALIHDYQQDLKSSVEALSPEPWTMLVTLHDESLFTPEAEAELAKVMIWRKNMGMTKVGLMFVQTIGSDILKAQMTRMYDAAGVEHAYFDNIDDARIWLGNPDRPAD